MQSNKHNLQSLMTPTVDANITLFIAMRTKLKKVVIHCGKICSYYIFQKLDLMPKTCITSVFTMTPDFTLFSVIFSLTLIGHRPDVHIISLIQTHLCLISMYILPYKIKSSTAGTMKVIIEEYRA